MTPVSDAYIGLPFLENGRTRAGVDCKGLVQMVLDDHMPGTALPIPQDISKPEEILRAAEAAGQWARVEAPDQFDVVVMDTAVRSGDRFVLAPLHVGIMTSKHDILHIDIGKYSECPPVSATHIRIRNPRFYRHISRV